MRLIGSAATVFALVLAFVISGFGQATTAQQRAGDAGDQRHQIESAAAFSFEAPRCDRVVAAVFEQIEAMDRRAW